MLCAAAVVLSPSAASAQPIGAAPLPPRAGAPALGPGFGPSQEARWTTPAPPPKRLDPLVVAGFTELAVGGVFTLAGAIAVGVAESDEEVCGQITGCFTSRMPDLDALRGGAGTLGFGLGVLATGGTSLIVTAAGKLGPGETRADGPLATAGHAFLATGVGFFVSGWSYGSVASYSGNAAYDEAWPLFLASGVMLSAGIPMLAVGATFAGAEDRGKTRARERLSARTPGLHELELRVGPGTASARWRWL